MSQFGPGGRPNGRILPSSPSLDTGRETAAGEDHGQAPYDSVCGNPDAEAQLLERDAYRYLRAASVLLTFRVKDGREGGPSPPLRSLATDRPNTDCPLECDTLVPAIEAEWLLRGEGRMARPKNRRIQHFKERIDWILENLDCNADFARFCTKTDDIQAAFKQAYLQGTFVPKRFGGWSEKTWHRAMSSGTVPDAYIEWLCALFPDLNPDWLTFERLENFLSYGSGLARSRTRWRAAIEFLSENRQKVAEWIKPFYRAVDASQEDGFRPRAFPLIVGDQWIRSRPLQLAEDTESDWLSQPAQGISFPPQKLEGLSGDYISFKGAVTYRKRRAIFAEPQHNGEIFCVDRVNLSDEGFVGFSYYLSHYYDYVNTSEVLGAEVADWMLTHEGAGPPNAFPLRGTPANAFDWANRAAYPGVNCLTIFLGYREQNRLERGDYFLLHKRDETQLQAQNTTHVLPAGGHQPFAKGASKPDTAIWRTVVREFLEELFDKEELYRQPETWEDFLVKRGVANLVRLFFRRSDPLAKIFLLGFGLDPVTLKPEVLVAITIDWARLESSGPPPKLSFNWEVKAGKAQSSRHQWVPLSKENLLMQARGRVQSIGDAFLDTLPAGAACMELAAVHFDEICGLI